jgi:hypothetical protein
MRLRPECEVIIFGKAEGVRELVDELGLTHIPDIACNQWGTPLVGAMLQAAEKYASHEKMALVNGDIIFTSDLLSAVSNIDLPRFLLIGARWNLEKRLFIDFSSPHWEKELRSLVRSQGCLFPGALDYFVFKKGIWQDLPPLAVGRPGYDNYLVYAACEANIPVIDGTDLVTAVHQNHDYSHHKDGWEGVWRGPEAESNIAFLEFSDPVHVHKLEDATHCLRGNGLMENPVSRKRKAARAALFPHPSFP